MSTVRRVVLCLGSLVAIAVHRPSDDGDAIRTLLVCLLITVSAAFIWGWGEK